jgi:hypothetical protein
MARGRAGVTSRALGENDQVRGAIPFGFNGGPLTVLSYFLLVTPSKDQKQKADETARSDKEREEAGENRLQKRQCSGERWWAQVVLAKRGVGVIKPARARPGRMGSWLRPRVPPYTFPLPHSSALTKIKTHFSHKNAAPSRDKNCDKHNFLNNDGRRGGWDEIITHNKK